MIDVDNGTGSSVSPTQAADNRVVLAQVMLPTDANAHGNVHGGTLMKLADTACAIAAMRHARHRVVTIMMDSMTFESPVLVGDLVSIGAQVSWVGRTSIEVEVLIEAEDVVSGRRRATSAAFFVYVALDDHDRPRPVLPFVPSTDGERAKAAQAEERRRFRLAQRTGDAERVRHVGQRR